MIKQDWPVKPTDDMIRHNAVLLGLGGSFAKQSPLSTFAGWYLTPRGNWNYGAMWAGTDPCAYYAAPALSSVAAEQGYTADKLQETAEMSYMYGNLKEPEIKEGDYWYIKVGDTVSLEKIEVKRMSDKVVQCAPCSMEVPWDDDVYKWEDVEFVEKVQ